MSAAFVVDCSMAMAWLFHDEATPKTVALLNQPAIETALVPAWWFIEITNVCRDRGTQGADHSDAV